MSTVKGYDGESRLLSTENSTSFGENQIHKCDCGKLFAGDLFERLVCKNMQENPYNNENYLNMTSNCTNFRIQRKYIMSATHTEIAFPLAYSILVYKDIERFERLLRSIYRPQNYYCVHVDKKSPTEFTRAVIGIASCFENIFTTPVSVDVQWAHFSVLEPEFLCMEELWKYKNWKYFINLTGQEFPLKTNLEMVKILSAFNGSNNIEGTVKRFKKSRVNFIHKGAKSTGVEKSPAPVNVSLTKGSVHIVATRGFIDFMLHDKGALKFRTWIKDTGVPDETFFATLNYSPQLKTPGSYKGIPETDSIDTEHPQNPFVTRFKNWGNSVFNWPCGGKRVRMICIFGVDDLPQLSARRELFANKFHQNFQPKAYTCMEDLIYRRAQLENITGTNLNITFYESLDFVRNHV